MAFAASWLLTLLLTSLVSAAALGPRGVPKGHKEFDLYVTWGTAAPDGFARDLFLVNGQTPGPVLDIDQGDSVVVRVHNKSPFNMTTHFHGMPLDFHLALKPPSDQSRHRNDGHALVRRRAGRDAATH